MALRSSRAYECYALPQIVGEVGTSAISGPASCQAAEHGRSTHLIQEAKVKGAILLTCLSVVVSTSLHAQQVKKEQWIAHMRTIIPAYFCNSDDSYFRQCFKVNSLKCEEVAASTGRICLGDLESQIPAVLNQPEDGTFWGQKVGRCAGIAYEASLKGSRISNSKCNDISNWQ